MLKRTALVMLCVSILCVSFCVSKAQAVESRAVGDKPTLSFSGTTAVCDYQIIEFGKSISVTLELWNGTTLIDSWEKRGTSIVKINEECQVVSGQYYTLRVHGTCDGVPFTGTPVAKRCP